MMKNLLTNIRISVILYTSTRAEHRDDDEVHLKLKFMKGGTVRWKCKFLLEHKSEKRKVRSDENVKFLLEHKSKKGRYGPMKT